MNAFIALVRKDLVLYFSNRRALLMSIAAPILIAAFFGIAVRQQRQQAGAHRRGDHRSRPQRAVRPRGRGHARRRDASPSPKPAKPRRWRRSRRARWRPRSRCRPASAQLAGQAMFGGAKPELVLHYDPSQAMALQVVRGLLAQHVMQTVSQSLMSASSPMLADLRDRSLQSPALVRTSAGASWRRCSTASRRVQGASAPDRCRSAPHRRRLPSRFPMSRARRRPARGRRSSTTATHTRSPAWACSSCCSWAWISASGLLLMRRMGLWKRLRAAPLSRGTAARQPDRQLRADRLDRVRHRLCGRDGGLRRARSTAACRDSSQCSSRSRC